MAYRQFIPQSPSPSKRSDIRGSNRSLPGSVRESQNGKDRTSTTGSSIYGYLIGGRGMEAREIIKSLETGAVILTGGRDPEGGPILTFPCNKRHIDITHHDISNCLSYLIQIPSEETKRRGFTVVVDNRDDSWSNLVTVLGCLKQCLGDYLKQVYVLQREYDRKANRKDRPSYNIQPQFVVESQLHSVIDRNQLPEEVGGYLTYNHSIWLQNIMSQEQFMRDAQSVVQHLDNEEVKIQRTYKLKDPQASPLEALRQHRYFQETIMTGPTAVIHKGRDILSNLQRTGHGRFRSGNESISTLDNLEVQKQVKRVIQYLENRIDKLRDYLEDRDKSLNMNLQTEDWKRCVKTVVNWILGPGEKLLASHTDIGDSFETAEELWKRHEEMEIKCTDTYGQYAELRHQGDELINEETIASGDIRAERDYMDTVCRSFAARLERRRILLITSVRFHRFAENFSRQLDSLLELLCSDVSAETVQEAEDAIKNLNEMCQAIDHAAQQTLNDGQSLLDEMSRPIKNAFGNDISPDYDGHIKNINQKLEDLQERKMRCDELADVRKLKLQQILQLRTCERDADKAIDWIEELLTVMVHEHHDLGRSSDEAETLQNEHKTFESTAAGTYEYGKQLLQGALVLRRSLRYDLEPNNERAYRLEEAWKRFTQGTGERANRLTVASMFMVASDKINDRIEQILVVISQALDRQITVDEVLSKYQVPKDKVVKDYEDTFQMGRALLDRIVLPVVIDETVNEPRNIENEKSVDTINTKLRRMDRKLGDLQKYWSELVQNRNNPNFVPKLTRTPSRRKVADLQEPPKRSPSKRSGRQKSLDGKDKSKHKVQGSNASSNEGVPKYPEIEQRIAAIRSYQQASALGDRPPGNQTQDNTDSMHSSPQSQYGSNSALGPNVTRDSYQGQMASPDSNPEYSQGQGSPNYNPEYSQGQGSFHGLDYSHPSSMNYSAALQELPSSRGSRTSYQSNQPVNADDQLLSVHAKPVFIEAPSMTSDLYSDMEKSGEWIRVRVHQMEPDLVDVGSTLEEALQLKREHDDLVTKLKSKEGEVQQLLQRADTYVDENRSQADVYAAMADTLGEAWKALNEKLEYRGQMLDQSISFHNSVQDFNIQMEHAHSKFSNVPLATNVETARSLLQQHNEIKSGILESSKITLDMGHALLQHIKEMGVHADIQNKHATTAACYGIEHLLELLHDRRRHLEELWELRRQKLEQCLQLCQLDQEVNKILDWFRMTGAEYLRHSHLGETYAAAKQIQEEHNKFETQARDIQETVLQLIRTADQLLRRTNLDAEGVRQRLLSVDTECENFMNKLDNRRRNIAMSVSFYNLQETALTKLEQIEVQLNNMDLPRNSAELAEQHAQLSNAIVEMSTPALREGRLLLERVSRGDSGADGVRQKMDELQARCAQLESLCKARRAQAWERSQAYLQFQERYNSLHTWLSQIGQATLRRHGNMGNDLNSAKEFLEIHEQLDEDIRDKNAELEALSAAVVNLVKSGDQEAQIAAEKVDALHKQMTRLQRVVEIRIQLALLYVSFYRLGHQLKHNLDGLEHIMRSETENLQDLTETAVSQMQELFSKTANIHSQFEEKGKSFLQNSSSLSEDSSLEIRQPTLQVEQHLSEMRDQMNALSVHYESWTQKISSSKQFRSQWHQFIQDARKTIDKVAQIENDFFPFIAGDLGTTEEATKRYQAQLDEFMPAFKKATQEIEEHLKTAEMLSLKGDTHGQKDQIVNELVKVHQRFQARINEYQILLKMTITFFRNLHQLDQAIEATEKEYMQSELPSELTQAEIMLEEHKRKKQEVSQMIHFTADEGDKIVRRVRQQDAEATAQDDVQRVIDVSEGYKERWNYMWEEQEKRLQQNLQICQFNFDLRQIHSEIDGLHQHLQARRGSYGNSLPSAKMTSQAYGQFEITVELIEEKINSFISTAELMVQDKHYDSVHIRREIDVLKNKWSTFHTSVHDYRQQLNVSILYFTLTEESETWMREGNQLLITIGRDAPNCRSPREAEDLIKKLETFVTEGKPKQEERVNKIAELCVQLYGDQGPSKVRHIVIQYQDLMQSFEQADNEITGLKENLQGKQPVDESVQRQTAPKAAAPTPGIRPPRIIQHLKNADVMEGVKFTFECRIESEAKPEIQWCKDNLPLTSPDYETRFVNGIATLTIEETFSEDTARYTCRVSNPAGMAESSAQLNVKALQAPVFHQPLQDVTAPEGKGVRLQTRFTASPPPEVVWYRGNNRLAPNNTYKITIEVNFSALDIREIYPEDQDTYTVVIRNPAGETRSSCNILVEPFLSSTGEDMEIVSTTEPEQQAPKQAPVFMQLLPPTKEAMEGTRVRLDCIIVGHPEPEVIWLHNDKPIKESKDIQLLFEGDRCTTVIHEALLEDAGEYRCFARNPHGQADSACKLHVEAVSEMSDASVGELTPPKFTQLLKDLMVKSGQRVCLQCRVTGHPLPEVKWFRDDRQLESSPDFQITAFADVHSLTIPEAFEEDSGVYSVRAVNVAGEAKCLAKLNVRSPPEQPAVRRELKPVEKQGLKVAPPEFRKLFTDRTVLAGHPITFECTITGSPRPKVKWHYNGAPLVNKAYLPSFEGENYKITIPDTTPADAGRYDVHAENPHGKATCSALLQVEPTSEMMTPSKAPEAQRPVAPKPTPVSEFMTPSKAPEAQRPVAPKPTPVSEFMTPSKAPQRKGAPSRFPGDDHPKPVDEQMVPLRAPKRSEPPRFPERDESKSVTIRPSNGDDSYGEDVPMGYRGYESSSEITETRTITETRRSKVYSSSDETYGEHHSTTYLTDVSPRPQKSSSVDRFATTLLTDVTPQYQPVDLTIEVPVPPKFLQALKNITSMEGTRVTFDGVVAGRPEPSIRWFREGKELTDQADFEISYCQGRVTLTIPEAFEEDAGLFTSTAENIAGSASSTAELIVRASMIPPSFTDKLQRHEAKEGEPVKLIVRVSGQPAPQVTWMREGSKLVSSRDFEIIQEGDIHSLYIPEVFYEDSGKYTVKAENPAGEAQCIAQLVVEPPPLVIPTTPVLREPERRPVFEHVEPSKAPGAKSPRRYPEEEPMAKIAKYQKAAPPKQEPQKFRHEMEMEVEGQHLPTYEQRINLFPEQDIPPPLPKTEPPRQPAPTKVRPTFSKPLTNQKVQEGDSVTFEIIVEGHPEPIIRWFRNDAPVESSPDYELSYSHNTHRLTIIEVFTEDAGRFKCVATNATGSVVTECYLVVEVEPMEPVTETITPVTQQKPAYVPPPPQPAPAPAPAPVTVPPSFVQPLKDIHMVVGTNFKMECRIIGKPFPQITWVKDGHPVYEGPRHKINSDSRTGRCALLISKCYSDDIGQYTCQASNIGGVSSTSADILPEVRKVEDQPLVSDLSPVQELLARSQAPKKPEKEFYRTPTERLIDRRSEERILAQPEEPLSAGASDSEFTVTGFEQRLMEEINYRDGKIKIMSETETEYDSEQPEEKVGAGNTQPPEILQQLNNSQLVEGGDATFICKIVGKPRPKIAWYRNGKRIKKSNRYEIKYGQDNMSVLRIRVTLPEDTGYYTVLAVNSVGKATTSAQLYVDKLGNIDATSFMEPDSLKKMLKRDSERGKGRSVADDGGVFDAPAAPVFKKIPDDLTAVEGSTIRFDCLVTGRPAPELDWYRDGILVHRDDNHKIVVNENGIHSIIINTVSRSDSGTYNCIAQNKAGEDRFTVNLNISPKQEKQQPRFIERVQNFTVKEGMPVTLSCHALGIPTPIMSWQKDGTHLTPINNDYRIDIEGGRTALHIEDTKMSDAAWYQCTAANTSGSATTRAKLVVQVSTRKQLPEKRKPAPQVSSVPPPRVTSPAITDRESAVREYIRREGEAPPEEDLFVKDKQKPPRFRTQIKDLISLKENDSAHFECRLIPLGDPNMKVEWFKDGQPLLHGHRFKPMYDFGFVALDMLYTYPEDNGNYSCRASNLYGEDQTVATLHCKPKRGVIADTQLPGDGAIRLQEMEDHWRGTKGLEEKFVEAPQASAPPEFDLKMNPVETGEGEPAKFMVKVQGYPRPRVNWWVNGSLIVTGSRYKVTYDGMIHYLEIPRVREYDAGQVRVTAKNPYGEQECSTSLVILPKEDWRARLRQAPKGDLELELKRRQKMELRSVELDRALKKPKATEFEFRRFERMGDSRVTMQRDTSTVISEQKFISKQVKLEQKPSKPLPVEAAKPEITFVPDINKITERQVSRQQISLDLGEPPAFTSPLRPVRVPEGKPVTLDVKFTGRPEPNITWYRDSFEIHPCRDFQITTTPTSSQLKIPEVFVEDAGLFTVKAYNTAGMVQCKAKLNVVEEDEPERVQSPEFRNLMRDTLVVAGEPITFDCKVSGAPKPKVHWLKDNQPLKESSRWKFIEEDDNYTLLIFEVTPEDVGQYACVAINDVGKSTCTARLDVEIPMHQPQELSLLESFPRVPEEAPQIIEPPNSTIEVEEGGTVTFKATITGQPAPIVSWYRDTILVKPSKYFCMLSTPEGVHTLTIQEAFSEDTGTYRCVARNKSGEIFCTTYLKVIGLESEPEHHQVPPSFSKPIQNTIVNQGQPAQFTAEFRGLPQPDIKWLRNGIQHIQNSKDFQITVTETITTLIVREAYLHDTGLITCQAKNKAGTAECSAELYVQEIPKSEESITEIADKTEEIVEGLVVSLSEKRVPEISGVITIDTVEDETHIETEEALHTLVTQKTVETISQEIILQEESSERPSDATFKTAVTETVEVTVKESHETVTLVQEKPAEEKEAPVSPQREVAPNITVESEEYQLVEQETSIVPEQVDQVEDKPEGVAPIFIQELQYIEAVEGKPVQFRCVVSGQPTPEITWLLDGEPIEDAKFEKLTESDGTCILRIPETYPEDEGEYECSAINDFGSASTKADLYIQVPAEQTDITFDEIITQESSASQNIFTTETEELVLSASVEQATILVSEEILSEKEKLVTAEEEKEDVSDEEVIHFESAKEDEAEVRTVPVIQQHLASIHTKDGGQAMFECVVAGIPKPKIEWYKDSEVLYPSEEFQIQYDENNLCSLFIGDVLPEDAGQYTVVAKNEMGETSTTAQLFVEAAEDYVGGEPTESVEGIAPTFTQKPSYQKVDEGKDVSFECQIIAKPQPEIYWTKDGSDVPEDERINITLDTEGDTYHASLDIAESSPKDAGTYTITAANPQGQESVSVSLIVNKVLEEKTDFRDQLSTTVEVKDKDKPSDVEQVDFRETLTTEVKTKVNVHFQTQQLDFRHLLRKGNTASKKFESDVSTEETITVQEPVTATDVPQSIEEVFEVQQPKIISPKFDLVIDDLQVKEGDSAKLICHAHGVPTPTITWYHATEEIHTDDVYEITTGEEGESTLHIPEVLIEDAGLYTAKASNEAGQIECTSTINVEEVPSDQEETLKDVKEVTIETTEEEEADKAAIKIQAAFRGYQAREQVKVLREQSLVEDVNLQPEDSTDFVIQQLVDESTMQEFQHLHAGPNPDELEVGMKVFTWRISKGDRNSPLPEPTLFKEEFEVSDSYFPYQMKLEDNQEETQQNVSYEFSMKQQSITLDEASVNVDTKAEILLTQPAPEEPQKTQDVEGEFTLDYQEQVEDVSVDVTMAPVFQEVLEDQEVTEGTTVILTATVSGKPAPEVSWIKEGEDACIKSDDHYEITKDTEGHFTLTIHKASLDDDAQFTCKATNIAGTATISADLYVQPGGEAPTFIKCIEDVTVEYNAPFVLEVQVKGQPKPELTWTIDNEEIPSSRYRIEQVKDVVRLIIDKSELDDEGEYAVKATNSKGVATCHAEVRLRINGPEFDKPLEDVSTRLKDTAQLQCDVTGIPFPEVKWFVDGEPITKGPKYNYSCENRHCVLTINDVSTEDVNKKYTCKAENAVGDASTSATLTVEGLLYF